MTSPHAGRRLLRALIGVAATGVFLAFATSAVATPSPATPPYHVNGNQVLGANGKQFVPDGFVIDCAAFDEPVDTLCAGDYNQDPWTGEAMLTAAAGFWHADVIRLQVSSEQLFPGQDTIDESYLKLIDSLVDEATALHLATIVSLQTEYYKGPALLTAGAVRFWNFMARNLGANPSVMFDLYNEPRLNTSSSLGEKRRWHLWEDGGTYDGVTYVGDQALVNTIRVEGAKNVIIAEGNKHDRDLTLLSSPYLTDRDGTFPAGSDRRAGSRAGAT